MFNVSNNKPMPLYDYQCQSCNNVITKMNSIENRNNINEKCDDCGSTDYKLKVSAPQVVSGVTRQQKRPDWFKDRMKEIKKHVRHTGSDQFNSNS